MTQISGGKFSIRESVVFKNLNTYGVYPRFGAHEEIKTIIRFATCQVLVHNLVQLRPIRGMFKSEP